MKQTVVACDMCGATEGTYPVVVISQEAEDTVDLCPAHAREFMAALDTWRVLAHGGAPAPAGKPAKSSAPRATNAKKTSSKPPAGKPAKSSAAKGSGSEAKKTSSKPPAGEVIPPSVVRAARAWAIQQGIISENHRDRLPEGVLDDYLRVRR